MELYPLFLYAFVVFTKKILPFLATNIFGCSALYTVRHKVLFFRQPTAVW